MRGRFRGPFSTADPRLHPQTDVPSQQDVPGQAPPFDPSGHPDMQRSFLQTRESVAPFFDVRSVHDSRPLFGYDFYWEDQFVDGIRQTPPFVVPEGWTFLLRTLAIEMFPNSPLGSATVFMSPFGQMGFTGVGVTTPKLQILVNGNPTPMWTQYGPSGLNGVPLFNVFITGITIETFVVIPARSNFTIFIPNWIDPGGVTTIDTQCAYYGQMLMASGREPTQDVGNAAALPVQVVK